MQDISLLKRTGPRRKCWAESTCRGACSTERDVVAVADAAKKARKGSIDTNIFGGAAFRGERERAISRFPEH